MRQTTPLFLLLLLACSWQYCFSFDFEKALSDKIFPFVISEPPPLVASTYKDPIFGSDITRITNVRKRNPSTRARGVVNEYARFDPLNADGSMAIFHGTNGYWFLYDMKTLEYKKSILSQGKLEPRWDVTDPDVLFYISEKKFYKYNVKSSKKTLLYDVRKEYPNASWITTQGEGDGSVDRKYWAFIVVNYNNNTQEITFLDWIVFDAETKSVLSRYSEIEGNKITDTNTVSMSMTGEYVLVETDVTQVFNRDWTNGRKLPGRHGHGDLALSIDGRDVFVSQDTSTDFFTMIYLDTLEEVNLMVLPFQTPEEGGVSAAGYHISGNSYKTPGWVLVSTYGENKIRSHWGDGTLFLLELKENGRHLRVSNTFTNTAAVDKDYWSEAFAAIDRQGKYVFWGSNWGEIRKDYADVYRLTLPENWYRELSGK